MTYFLEDIKQQNFAYISIGKFKSGKFAEAQKIFEAAIQEHQKIGFKGAYLFNKPGTDEAIAVVMWTKKEDMQTEQAEAYQKIISTINPLYVKNPLISFYQVSSEIMPEPGTEIQIAIEPDIEPNEQY